MLQRRAERGLGVAIRQGQADGTIKTPGGNGKNQHSDISKKAPGAELLHSPYDFAKPSELKGTHGKREAIGIYALADNGTEQDFTQAQTQINCACRS